MFAAGTLSNPYPVRRISIASLAKEGHSLRISSAHRRRLTKQFRNYFQVISDDTALISNRFREAGAGHIKAGDGLDPETVAWEFARFAKVLQAQTGQSVTQLHIESAFAMLHRRVEVIPRRIDRAISIALTCSMLAASGVRVHLVVDNGMAVEWLEQWLLPIYTKLGFSTMAIQAGASEHERSLAYQQTICLMTARECAMDFLRDAVKWPDRSNPALSRLERITGKRSRLEKMLMQGLPCGVFMDIDASLIDNASTPLALTRDAHPMHETEELGQALEMVTHLERGKHYLLTEEGAEVALTELGIRQLEAWSEKLGGGWGVPHVAQLMLAVAIVATTLVRQGTHYRVRKNRIEWLLEDVLVPGMIFYGHDFLERVVELREECGAGGQRELVARASYQQVFNRYLHLCGACHSLELIEKELGTIYGLRAGSRWPPGKLPIFAQIKLFDDQQEKYDYLRACLTASSGHGAWILVADNDKSLAELLSNLEGVPLIQIESGGNRKLATCLQAGTIVTGLSSVLEYQALSLSDQPGIPLKVVYLDRSPRRSEDLRNRYWITDSLLRNSEQWLILSSEDEIFADVSSRGLQSVLHLSGTRFGRLFLERRLKKIQADRAHEAFLVRQGLLSHESTMHSLLSFSGRELYE